jgi:hypothetical protein
MRHPDFPKSICGVVYQGASAPGCQFSFACDGSMARPPIAPYWQQAKAVAEAALSGYVDGEVGPATYYHADYVFPHWEPDMVKVGQVGTHIFYRYAGPSGTLEALCGRYEGRELKTPIPKPPKLVEVVNAAPPPPALKATTAADGRKVGRLNVEAHPHMPDEREYVSMGPPQTSPQPAAAPPTITPPSR